MCHRKPIFVCLLPIALMIAGCSDRPPSSPSDMPAVQASTQGSSAVPGENRSITILDQCDPASFNAAIGAGACVNRNGGITFDAFVALLQEQARVPSWRFSPDTIHVPRDLTLAIINRGGEEHTFTEVEEFGGGVIPFLNNLAGTPVPAPECVALGSGGRIPAGGQTSHTFEPGEADKYQCCIHPWMRAVTR